MRAPTPKPFRQSITTGDISRAHAIVSGKTSFHDAIKPYEWSEPRRIDPNSPEGREIAQRYNASPRNR